MSKRNDLIGQHYLKNYSKLLKRTINRVPNNSKALAEEVVQEAYARALKYFRTFNPKTNDFDVWLQSILRNATNDCRTIEQEHGCTVELHDNIEELVPPRRIDYVVVEKHINDAVLKDRQTLTMFFIHGYKSADISEFLSINHNTVRQIILRFKQKVNLDA